MHIMITGASKGIGLAIARKFANVATSTLRISICSRNIADLRGVAAHLEGASSRIQVFASNCDVGNENQVVEFVEDAQARFGTVDVLVNNAGFGIFRPVHEMTTEEFDSVMNVNLRGVYLMSRAVLTRMVTRKGGTIVTISSLAGKNGFAGGAAYCAAKFGVRGLMQSLFLEVRSHDIRVITIFPGSVDTEFFNPKNGSGTLKSKTALKPEDIADCVYHTTMLPTRADISELDIRPTNPKS